MNYKTVQKYLNHSKCRKLTREEKVLLKKQGYEPKDFLRTNKTAEGYEFVQVSTGKPLNIRR